MQKELAIKIENVKKQYRLGTIGGVHYKVIYKAGGQK